MGTEPRLMSDMFSIRQAAAILNRSAYAIWYHATHHYDEKPVRGRNILLHRDMLIDIVQNHLRLKDNESKQELIERVKTAVSGSD
jgi:hypothetical protein